MSHLEDGPSVNEIGETGEVTFDKVTSLFVRFMRLHGLLPLKDRRLDCLLTRVLLSFYVASSLVNWSMLVCYCIRMCFQRNLTVDAICETVIVIGYNARYYLLIGRRREYAEMFEECRAIWNDECDVCERNVVAGFARKMHFLFVILLGNGCAAMLMYTATALSSEGRVLPYKWYVENPEDYWPGYTAALVIQTVVMCNAGTYLIVVDMAVPMVIMFCCGFLRSVSDRFDNVNDDFNAAGQSLHLTVTNWLKLHQRILKLCSRLEKFARNLFLTQILFTAYNLSLVAIKLVSTDPDRYKYIPVLTMSAGQLFICQWTPDYLLDESLEVATAAYFAAFDWTKRSVTKLMIIVVARAQIPVRMTAGGFIPLSLETYGHMMASAFSFFTMLRNLNI